MNNIEAIEKIKTLLFGLQAPAVVKAEEDVPAPTEAPAEEASPEASVEEQMAAMQSEITAIKEMIVAIQQQLATTEEVSQDMAKTFRAVSEQTLELVQKISQEPTAAPAQQPKESLFKKPGTVNLPFHQVIKK
jgi:predicted component of type VI protein secretion system